MTKGERLAEFIRRLALAPPAADHDAALGLIEKTLNTVEDELSGIPYNPAASESDGRMYPPSPEYERKLSGRPGVRRYRQRGHNTLIGSNGAIEISDLTGAVIGSKQGKDGKGVPQ